VLLTELDILGLINAKDVYRGRHGNTREVSLIMQEELVETVLLEDHKLNAVSDIRLKTGVYVQ
jgi:Cdc6-like AAA superfamily ATPase